eukprot:jgi/Galph1/4802/GphlegSOOS_G3455.1
MTRKTTSKSQKQKGQQASKVDKSINSAKHTCTVQTREESNTNEGSGDTGTTQLGVGVAVSQDKQITEGDEQGAQQAFSSTTKQAEENENRVQKNLEEGSNEVSGSNPVPFQNPLQKKLFDIRLKMNEGRKLNAQAVEAELKNSHFGGQSQRSSWKHRENNKKKENEFLNGAKDKFWRETAEQAEQHIAKEVGKKRRSGQKLVGETIYGEDNLYRAYERRLTRIPVNDVDANLVDKNLDELEYGQNVPVRPERLQTLVNELEETEARRSKFSKWHKFDEETADISFINERNRRFNDKIARSFDEYTAEIRQNLERGTALP